MEQAGASESITSKICHRVLTGEDVVAEDITVAVDSSQEHLKGLVPATKKQTVENLVLSRRGISQHIRAMAHILNAMVNEDTPLTEAIIPETHRILVTERYIHNRSEKRTHTWKRAMLDDIMREMEHVSAWTTNFSRIAKAMIDICQQFEQETKPAESKGKIDPIFLAAKYCQDFVMIHPFLDRNGRMCRLI